MRSPLAPLALLILAVLTVAPGVAAEPTPTVVDSFTDAPMKERSPARGDWKIGGGVARCKQDDALFKKNNDHGPIIWYKTAFQDGTIHFAFQPDQTKTFVFTIQRRQRARLPIRLDRRADQHRRVPARLQRPQGAEPGQRRAAAETERMD